MSESIKAVSATVQLSETLSIDGYMLPDGEFRAGAVGVSAALGYKRNWLLEIEDKSPDKLKTLSDKGYRGTSLISVQRTGRGGSNKARTISLRELTILITAEALSGNKRAIALQAAFTLEGLDVRFRDAFSIPQRTPEEKRQFFGMTYEEFLEAIAENREELEQLRLPGDDIYYPDYQDWEEPDQEG